MIIDNDKKYIYVAIPKTGSISIHFSLGHVDIPEPPLYHMALSKILPDSRYDNYFKFSFVRNPWSRILSLYKDFTIKRVYQYSGKIRHEKPLFHEFTDFNDFCLRVAETQWINDVFLQSQHAMLSVNGVIACDFVGKYESLETDFNKVCSLLDINVQLQKMNVGQYDLSYRDYYSDASKDAIGNLFYKDVEEFNYEF